MKFNRYVLENGLRVIINPLAETKSVSVVILVGAGSRYEKKEISGISHFLEHMAFKGTKKRPRSRDIATEIDSVGGLTNAYTETEKTGFYIKMPSQHLDLALDILSDILLNSTFPPKELEGERKVVIEEINHYDDTPSEKIYFNFSRLVFGDTPLGRSVLGQKKTLVNIKREDFLDYLSSLYTPENIVVNIAGNVEEKIALEKVKKYFENMRGKKELNQKDFIPKSQSFRVFIETKKTDQTHICLGVRAYSLLDKRRTALRVLSIILGGTMSSRLWTEIRDKLGLAYVIGTGIESYRDTGILTTFMGVTNEKTEKAVSVVAKEYQKIATKKVPEKELKKAREFLKGNFILRLEDSLNLADFFGSQELLENRIKTEEELLKEIDQVTTGDILKIAQDIFAPRNLNLAIIGPFKDKEKFDKIIR